jgi:beta-phosphoglucomutase-like phosphatase (HAD superfamily)
VEMMLRVLGVAEYFDTVVLGEEVAESKPSPVPYQVAMRRLGVTDPTRCVVFEDSLPGVMAGVAAGAIVVGVRTTQTDEALRKEGAQYTIRDFTELDVEKMIRELKDFVKPHANSDSSASNGPSKQ